jgi:hypothetical protein
MGFLKIITREKAIKGISLLRIAGQDLFKRLFRSQKQKSTIQVKL